MTPTPGFEPGIPEGEVCLKLKFLVKFFPKNLVRDLRNTGLCDVGISENVKCALYKLSL